VLTLLTRPLRGLVNRVPSGNIMQKQTILAIPGSLRTGSSNHHILRFISGLLPADAGYQIYEDLATIPPFDPGLDNEQPPSPVIELRQLIADAQAVIICTPEYAFGVPGQLKNALDWMVSSGSFSGKPTILITASTGGENAHPALLKVLGAIDADVVGDLLISFVRSKMDSGGTLSDEQTIEQIELLVKSILR